MRAIFMGTPAFAVSSLLKLIAVPDLTIAQVWTQPPRPAKRGLQVMQSPVHQAAQAAGIPVFTPSSVRSEDERRAALEMIAETGAGVAFVVAYGAILPLNILNAFENGCWNLHASTLPRWRGAAPIQRAIEAGDVASGATVMRMAAGLDTGPVWRTASVPIASDTTAEHLHDALATVGAELLADAAARLAAGEALTTTEQQHDAATYAKKITSEDARLDFTASGQEIVRKINAFWPVPGAWCYLQRRSDDDRSDGADGVGALRLRIKGAKFVAKAGGSRDTAGDLKFAGDAAVMIRCADGWIVPAQLQRSGKKWQSAAEFSNGIDLAEQWVLR